MFDDNCLPHITEIMENSPLTSLRLSRCNFTKLLFSKTDRPKFATILTNSKLRHLDVSYNNLTSGVEALMTSLPAVLLSLDLAGCSLEPEASHLVVSGLLSHGCRQSCDLENLNVSSLSLSDANIETLCSGLKHYKRLNSLSLDHNQITSKGLSLLMEAVVSDSLPISRLRIAMDFSADFWIDAQTVEVTSSKLSDILAKNSTSLAHFVVPSPKDGYANYLTKVWNFHHGSKSKHFNDGLGNLVLCID